MIKKLRVKFIILSTISLLLLLGIIVISSNLLTYRELITNADKVLDMIVSHDERMMPVPPSDKKEFPPDSTDDQHMDFWGRLGRNKLSPEIMYEARFFTADLSAVGDVIAVGTDRIAMVDEEEAFAYAAHVYRKKSDRGFIGEFRYVKLYQDNGNDLHVIFLDCGRSLFTFRNALLTNCLISFLGFIAIFIVIVVCSKKIVRPVSESYEKQKQFISVAGHEIKTPVTIIDADVEILAMEFGEENEWLQDISKQTKRMAALTNDLLTLSRMDENRQQFTMIDFPISDIVGETVQSFQTLAHSRNRNIIAEIAPMLSCCGDENSIRQIVGILLENAIKYTKESADGSSGTILLKLEKKNHNLYLSVKNSAEPVSEEQLRHFFDRFYRTEQSRNSETGGYGLGLSIAKSMVEAHRGRITASAPDRETVQLTVILPMK
ncbi:MAG: HAMP domain-containing histidine kinase [Lachnospiraceae bacterium]|nr:HAMP domain-containing histidine kinase [Lachnospiraceae bacterium]